MFSATAARNAQLTATVNALPPFLSQLRTTLGRLNTTLGLADPSLGALRPVAPLLKPALSNVIALSGPAIKLLHEAPSLLDADGGAAGDHALPDRVQARRRRLVPAAQLAPMIELRRPLQPRAASAMASLAADLQGTTRRQHHDRQRAYLRGDRASTASRSFGQSVREPTNRNNTYYSPGELSNLATGLFSANCANTANTSQVPLVISNVPCKVQPPYPWGSTAPTTPATTRT